MHCTSTQGTDIGLPVLHVPFTYFIISILTACGCWVWLYFLFLLFDAEHMSAHVTAFYHAVKDEVAGCEVWLFLDNSTNHTKVAHDALCATRMNVGPGQYNSIMLKHQAPVLPFFFISSYCSHVPRWMPRSGKGHEGAIPLCFPGWYN